MKPNISHLTYFYINVCVCRQALWNLQGSMSEGALPQQRSLWECRTQCFLCLPTWIPGWALVPLPALISATYKCHEYKYLFFNPTSLIHSGGKCEVDINECESNPCHHGGTCIDQSNSYTCHCPPGWVGPSCEIRKSEKWHLKLKTFENLNTMILFYNANVMFE